MKILLLGLNGRGGPLHYCSHLANHLRQQPDTEVHVLIPSYSNASLFRRGVKRHLLYAPASLFLTVLATLFFWQHRAFLREVLRRKPDVIDILDIHPWYLLYWPVLRQSRLVLTINDPELHSGEAGWLTTLALRWLTRAFLDKAEHIIALGKKQVETLKRMGHGSKDLFSSKIGSYASLGGDAKILPPDGKTVLFFGRIRHYKGLDILLKAFKRVKKKVPDARLLVVGEGNLRPYASLLKQCEAEVVNRFVDDAEIAGFFNQSSIVAMPYRDATQTGVVQIAYSFKRPVIASRVGSLPELVDDGKTGYLVPPNKVALLALSLLKLLQDKEKLLKFGGNAHTKLRTELDWQSIARDLRAYYDRIT